MYKRKIPEDLECGINVANKVLGGKWKTCIIDCIQRGIKRPSEIHQNISAAAPRAINMQLRELIQHGMICKTVHPGLPLKVEYDLTPLGRSILPIITALDKWGTENRERVLQVMEQFEEGEQVYV